MYIHMYVCVWEPASAASNAIDIIICAMMAESNAKEDYMITK